MDIEKEAIYETDVLVMGTDGLWDVTSNERVAETVHRSLEQFPIEDDARYRYRFTSAAQDLVMSSRGKLNERSWRTSDNKSATIDDISVFVIPLAAYKEEYLNWKLEVESQRPANQTSEIIKPPTNEPDIVTKTEAILPDPEPTSFTTVNVVDEEKKVEPIISAGDKTAEVDAVSQSLMNEVIEVIGKTVDPDESSS